MNVHTIILALIVASSLSGLMIWVANKIDKM